MQNLFSLEGRNALITGGSRGIGLMIARGLASHGAQVWLLARKASEVDAAAHSLRDAGHGAHSIVADLSRLEEIDRVAEIMAGACPKLDILVNNAAAVWNMRFADFTAEGWDKVANLNVRAPFFLIQRLLPLLEAAAISAGPARVINVASTDAMHVPLSETYSYTAAKAGLIMVTRMLCKQLGPRAITVNALAPGAFETRMTARLFETRGQDYLSKIPLGRFGMAEDIAGAAIFLASRAGAYVNGSVLAVDGGWLGAL